MSRRAALHARLALTFRQKSNVGDVLDHSCKGLQFNDRERCKEVLEGRLKGKHAEQKIRAALRFC